MQHGGTLLFLPDAEMRGLEGGYPVDATSRARVDLRDAARRYRTACLEYSKEIQRISDAEGRQERVHSHDAFRLRGRATEVLHGRSAVREGVRFVAALANVDGALVLGPDLGVLAFGAMIKVGPDSFDVRVSRTAAGDSPEVIAFGRLGGARHQSAARFCHAQPGALAVVISQDGRVSCLLNDGSGVRAWRGVRLDRRPSAR